MSYFSQTKASLHTVSSKLAMKSAALGIYGRKLSEHKN
jgi:hypothetical protein